MSQAAPLTSGPVHVIIIAILVATNAFTVGLLLNRDECPDFITLREEIETEVTARVERQAREARRGPASYSSYLQRALWWENDQRQPGPARQYFGAALEREPLSAQVWLESYRNKLSLGDVGTTKHHQESSNAGTLTAPLAGGAIRHLIKAGQHSEQISAVVEQQTATLRAGTPPGEWHAVQASIDRLSDSLHDGDNSVTASRRDSSPIASVRSSLKLWATPVRVYRLNAGADFHSALARTALNLQHQFTTTGQELVADIAARSGMDLIHDSNNAFFHWQLRQKKRHADSVNGSSAASGNGTGCELLMHNVEYQKLHSKVLSFFADFWQSQGLPEPSLLSTGVEDGSSVHSWVSVHNGGSGHRDHIHGDAMLSAVYYAQVPAEAGPLRLYDPRGVSPYEHLREVARVWCCTAIPR